MKIGWLDNVNLEQEMRNIACGDHWILPVVAWPVQRMVENGEISYWKMVLCVCPGLASRGKMEKVTLLVELLYVCSSLGQELDGQGTPVKEEWATSHDSCHCWLLRLNPGVRGELLTSQLSWVTAWLLVTRVCPVYLVEDRCYIRGVY